MRWNRSVRLVRAVSLWSFFGLLTVMSGGPVGAVPAITNGLAAAYEFNGNANDVSGNGNNGVVNGATLTTDRFGNPNSAYSFDGLNDYINSTTTFSPQSEGTVSLWFNHAPNPDGGGIFSSRSHFGYSTGDLIIQLFTDSLRAYYWNGEPYGSGGGWQNPISHSNSEPSSNVWHHLVFTWNFEAGSTAFLDDVNIGSDTVPAPIFGNLDIEIGRQGAQGQDVYFAGAIDDVYVYNRALSAAEVATLFAVPEPSTALLLGVGLAGLGMRRRPVRRGC